MRAYLDVTWNRRQMNNRRQIFRAHMSHVTRVHLTGHVTSVTAYLLMSACNVVSIFNVYCRLYSIYVRTSIHIHFCRLYATALIFNVCASACNAVCICNVYCRVCSMCIRTSVHIHLCRWCVMSSIFKVYVSTCNVASIQCALSLTFNVYCHLYSIYVRKSIYIHSCRLYAISSIFNHVCLHARSSACHVYSRLSSTYIRNLTYIQCIYAT